jgi:spore maturation protein CgeB
MRILIAGEWHWPWYEQACADALEYLGHKVHKFSWIERFYHFNLGHVELLPVSKYAEIEYRLKWGPRLFSMNSDLIRSVKEFQPHIFFAYRPTHIFPSTIEKIKKITPETTLVQYCNDDPFSKNAGKFRWRHLIRGIPCYDIHFVYRHHNINDFKKRGAKKVELLRSYYIAERNYPVELQPEDQRFVCDVVFAGHYEADFRVNYLESIMVSGVKLNLFGGGWKNARPVLSPNSPLQALYPIIHVGDEDYRKAFSGAKIALCFLSKLNRDTYTRRNFEIPATGAFMLSEYSDDLATLFEEGKEAEFFRSKEEMLNKISYYLTHDAERQEIARRGCERALRDGHDVTARMNQMVNDLGNIL